MCSKAIVLVLCFFSAVSLSGCKEGSGLGSLFGSGSLFSGGGSSDGGSSVVAALTSGSGSSGGSSGGASGGLTGGSELINPEPATLALLGSGLFAYAFLRRRKRK